jgi:hypothetical protein
MIGLPVVFFNGKHFGILSNTHGSLFESGIYG